VYSIRNRLNVTIIASMVLVLSLTAVFLYLRITDHVERVFDSAVFDKAQALISLTALDDEGLEFDFAEDGVMLEFRGSDAAQYYQVWAHDGQPLIKSPSLGAADLPRTGVAPGQHAFADLRLADGRAGRLVEINFVPRVDAGDKWEDADTGWRIRGTRSPGPPCPALVLLPDRAR